MCLMEDNLEELKSYKISNKNYKKSKYADKVLKNTRVVNVITKEIYKADIAIKGDRILNIGDCSKLIEDKTQVFDLNDRYVIPGFIDSHIYLETPMNDIAEFTRLSLPKGTTSLILEGTKLEKKLKLDGIKAISKEIALMPNHIYLKVPKYVDEFLMLYIYLKEYVITTENNMHSKGLESKEETINKLRNGEYILIREDSIKNNISICSEIITEDKVDSKRIVLASNNLLNKNTNNIVHINEMVSNLIELGVEPIEAIRMATINPATWLGLSEVGVLASGKYADIVVIDGKLENMKVSQVFLKGQLVVENEKLLVHISNNNYSNQINKLNSKRKIKPDDLKIKANKEENCVRSIGIIPNKNLTNAVEVLLGSDQGYISPCVEKDILPISVVGVEEYNKIGNSFVKGFKLRNGAIAQSLSHEVNSIIAVGTNYEDMAIAINHIIDMGGGISLVKDKKEIAYTPINMFELIVDDSVIEDISMSADQLSDIAKTELECETNAPFMHLEFLSLNKFPKWKITKKGLIDVENKSLISTIIE